MHLPEPALAFTLPSLHDGTVLDCRIYHPLSLASPTWHPRHAAVVAHPYAPLGGCHDDPIVSEVAGQLLRKEFIIATFNFRGAAHSAGRTSWTAKPERDDYASIVGFLVYYIHHLDVRRPEDAQPPNLVLAGYSYGAMVTTQLPPLSAILTRFESPSATSEAGHIRSQAETLAIQQREILHSHSVGRKSLRIGEGGGSPRRSHDHGRRSMSLDDAEEKLRKGVRDFMAKTRHLSPHGSERAGKASHSPMAAAPPEVMLSPIDDLTIPRAAYILISPLQGLITNLATMSRSPGEKGAELKMCENPTLAVFGNGDVFVAASKLRSWTTRMEGVEGSQFRGVQIEGAGHFWIEEGVLDNMSELVAGFAGRLLSHR